MTKEEAAIHSDPSIMGGTPVFVGAPDMPKPIDVKPLPGYRIWLRYDDAQGEIDLSDIAGRGVFQVWADPAVFNAVKIGSHGAIEWSPDLDLCPDAMYLRLTRQTAEAVFPGLAPMSADA
jgi:hypothetical protein